MSQASSRKNAVIILAVLLLPWGFYFFFASGKHHFKHLPVLGPFEISAGGDTVYHTIPDFAFVNQEGREITQKDVEGKIYVADFFFARCPSVCPKMAEQLQRVQKEFAAERQLRILSHSVDPSNDSVPVLEAYGKKHLVNSAKWHLLTGDKKQISEIAVKGYLISAGGDGEQQSLHSTMLVLVDKSRRIRGFYDGTDPAAVDTLITEIKVLMAEYAP